MDDLLKRWELSVEDLTKIVDENPSLRGFMMGYVSEAKVRSMFFSDGRIEEVKKDDDHDRKKKGDLTFKYKGHEMRVEAKSLQTNSVKRGEDLVQGKFQCDASDCRDVLLPSGKTVKTTCLLVGEFDIIAVNLFAFENTWKFAFARNSLLPRVGARTKKIEPEDKQYLLSTLMDITWPLQAPFVEDPFVLLDEIIAEKEASAATGATPQTPQRIEKPIVLEDVVSLEKEEELG
ncbi:restriction endonuclease [Paenibacillus sp. 5J-6]|uniref:Restriction endonuclease n=1 Tax=Paenibacillus silvestris TaxID=2606219 RepID=A0A6L8V073_9BACL|nr:restriction endonuclease [Paenibacillus silvestris]MZQ82719.1 restriction endonuclease [Paenibacillus silvestris]